MLQPRSVLGYFALCALLCLSACFNTAATQGNADNQFNNRIRNGERIRRNDGEVTIISLDEDFAKSPRALGILSSEARTFVQDGVTTEYSTQVLGTTLGTTYAKLLSTGSRVFYDNSRPSVRPKSTDAFLVFPTLLKQQTHVNSLEDEKRMKDIIDGHETYNRLTLDELFDLSDTKNVQKIVPPTADERENVVSVRKEYSVKRNSEIKPAKVKGNNELPTFTVSHEFAPSGFSFDAPEEKKEEIHKPGRRNGKALFRGGIPVKPEKKLDTVTYFGFADFTTTVGDTVIIFMPKTPDPPSGVVTSIQGEATLRPEDAAMPVVTSVKTFMSHSPGMATKTVTGHSLTMQTSLPTIVADPVVRESKAYEPVYVAPNRFGGDIEPSIDLIQPSEEINTSEIKSEMTEATEPLQFSTATTQIYNSAESALGLVKSIGGTEAYDGTTTVFTSFVVGTVIDGAYKQLTQSASSVFINVNGKIITTSGVGINIAPTSATEISQSAEPEGTTHEIHTTEENEITTESIDGSTSSGSQIIFPDETTSENELSNEVDQARKIENSPKDQTIIHDSFILPQSSTDYITRIVPSTVYKTFTYLTTFFIPDENGGQTTSIRSREVTSEEIFYVTKSISTDEAESTISPSEAITEVIPTTTPQEPTTVTEEARTEGTTPQIPVTNPDLITTSQAITTTELEDEEEKTTQPAPTPTTPKAQEEEEVDLIFKTLYTTYTYLTTFFQESSTSVSSREVVVTNVITTTLDNSLATNPAVAGLFGPSSTSVDSDLLPTSAGIGRPTTKYFEDSLDHEDDLFSSTLESVDLEKELQTATPALDKVNEINDDGLKTFYTTYTYFTTVFVDGETEVESRTEVYTNIVNPNSLATEIKATSQVAALFSSDYVSVLPDEQVESPEDLPETNQIVPLKSSPTRLYDSTISRQKIKDNEITPISEALAMDDRKIQPTNIDIYKYDTTMSRGHSAENTQVVDEQEAMEAKQKELSKEEKLLLGLDPLEDPDVEQKIVVDVTSSSSGGERTYLRDSYDDPDDQITSESNTEEIEPSFSPTILLQTSFTTFTYFTTVYKGSTSDVISRLDTVTNVVTETLKPSEIEASLSPEEATLPITYFTTFTYWTTLYKDGNTMVTSREETISNVVTPSVSELPATESIDITPTVATKLVLPTVLTSVVGENAVDSHLEPKQLDTGVTESTTDTVVITPSPATTEESSQDKKEESPQDSEKSSADLEPTTFYTTYTYFTTSYIGSSTVLNSRLETVTNIVTPSAEASDSVETNVNSLNATQKSESPVLKPTGLISTIRTSEVNDGTTTLLSTDVFGTYIDGLYAQVLESSTEIVTPEIAVKPTLAVALDNQPTGIVSINEGKIVDADGVSTTFYTTKAVGTYIDKLYAQVIESTTSIQVDEEKKTATVLDPSTTVVGSKTYRTGLVRLIEGSIVKDRTTTFYESRVIGTLIDNRYAQIIESTSSFKVEMTPTAVPGIAATSVGGLGITATATVSSSPSPAVIESSIGEGEDEQEDHENEDDEDGGKGKSKSRLSFSPRKKTFTPVIRPFASRPRPTFLPKKKTGDVGSATTITRNAFTPTITATPAVKSTSGFGSSRNRFAGGRRSSSSNIVQATATASSGRRFSGGRRGSSTASVGPVSSSTFRGRSSAARVVPTASSAFGSSSRRGGFNYRTSSAARSSSVLPGSSRFRIRPTQSPGRPLQTVASTTEDIVNTNDIGAITVATEDTLSTIQDEEQETSPPLTTTTESARRNNNPLLRFRRPPILQRSSTTTTTQKPSTTPARRSNLLRRPDSRGSPTTPSTPTRTKPSPTFPPRNRQRPSNSLFPPRSFFRKPTPADEAEEEENKEDKDENQNAKLDEENEFSDNDYEGSEHSEAQHSTTETTTAATEGPKTDRRGRTLTSPVQIRPFRRPGARTKRQAVEWGARSSRGSRYQRPTSRPTSYDYYVEDSEPLPSEVPATRTSRFKPRSRELTQPSQNNQNAQHSQQHSQHNQYNQQHNQYNQHQTRVRPTKASVTTERAQFTLRDKSSSQNTRTSNFKRPTSRRRPTVETTTVSQRPKPPRLRTQNTYNQQQETTHSSRNSGRRYSSSRRTPSRSRYRDSTDFDSYSFSPSSFDGTITVTHQVPTEVTIPVINGKVTEYKNVITAKPSLEILGPHQYTTTTGKIGNVLIQLTSEITSTLPNGAMEVTKFLVYETPTTSITFTPTTLRGRKTSFSHIVPSTVYDVRQEVSTVQPQIAANAPLANLLLSQLLLGNLNLQPNHQQINPLLGLQNQPLTPPTPTTEFKTKTTTYVTTVTDHTSTVLPLTFRGKEILTTIVDSSTQVITATEYLTETIVITPTVPLAANPQQINTLLLPALLQAQLLQNPQPTMNPLLGLQPQILPQDILSVQDERPLFEEQSERFIKRKPIEDEEDRPLNEPELEEIIEQPKPDIKTRKKSKKGGNKKPPEPSPVAETSVVTLYVSGRKPGDFSTILSTVTLGEESTVAVRKRAAEYVLDDIDLDKYRVEASKLPEIGSSFSLRDDDYLNNYVMSALNEVAVEGSELETQSLESIVGDVSKYITADNSKFKTVYLNGSPSQIQEDFSTDQLKQDSKSTKKVTGHFLSKRPAELAPNQRKGTDNPDWSKMSIKDTDESIFFKHSQSKRVKRQIEEPIAEQPRRRRVKVRVPIQRRVNIDEELEPSEAQRSHDITHQELLQTQTPDIGTRKVKVLRKIPKRQDNDYTQERQIDHQELAIPEVTPGRKRVAVRRRKPVSSVVYENYFSAPSENLNNDHYNIQPSEPLNLDFPENYKTEAVQPNYRRKKVLVARKRPVPTLVSEIPQPTRRKVLVARRKPVIKTEEMIEPATIFSNFFVGLQTDYDYESATINTELDGTNDDINYEDQSEATVPESDVSKKEEEPDIDDIRVLSWPDDQPSLVKFESSKAENSVTPESIVWFYQPSDEVLIEPTSSTIQTPATETPEETTAGNSNVEEMVDTVTEVSISDINVTEEISSTNDEEDKASKTSSDLTTEQPISTQVGAERAPPIYAEEPPEFENAPKFVRPTRFSVTKKPTRLITGYPGTRRRQSTQIASTTVENVDSIAATPSYKARKPSKKYSSETKVEEIMPTATQEILQTQDFEEEQAMLPSEETITPSMPMEEEPSSMETTPSLQLSTSSESLDKHEESTATPTTSFITTVVTSTRLRTYTYLVTRVNGEESITTSSTSVKPATKTLTLTIPVLSYTQSATVGEMEMEEGRGFPLATKVMSNGVEVIVAGHRTTMPGPEMLRRLTSSLTRPITLAPSTLSDAMMMLLPQDASQESQDLLTKTYMTTYTYRTTLLEKGATVVSSREEVVSNVVTEERQASVHVTPTPVTQVTLTASPSLATGVFHTTYTYLNTLVDGEQPLVLTSKRTVSNTITAPGDLLEPSEPAVQHTNTYHNTVAFTKTLADGLDFKIISTKDVVTQVIITESDNRASSVEVKPTTTDIVKTYFITYTYFNTVLEGESTVVKSAVATSSDVVTEKFVIPPRRTSTNIEKSEKITATRAPEVDSGDNSINVFATKTYLTTFTYFTTLLQDFSGAPSTVVKSSTNVVQNIVTETLDTELLDSEYLDSLRSSLQTDGLPIVATATLNNGQKMEITAMGEQTVKQTAIPSNEISSSFEESSSNNVITGSTIIFFDENDQIDNVTPTKSKTLAIEVAGHTKLPSTESNFDDSNSESLSSAESQALTVTAEDSETEEAQNSYVTSILASSTVTRNGATLLPGEQVIKFRDPNGNISVIPVSDPVISHPDGTHSTGTNAAVSNFLNLGSIGINSLNALGPVINAMAGLIKSNLKTEHRRRNDTIGPNEATDVSFKKNPLLTYSGPKPPARSPIYIPVGGLAADSVAEESQNLEGHNVYPDVVQRNKLSVVLGKPTMESPLLAGGIPISPGQVITANSDVIIGRPSIHGVRPPVAPPPNVPHPAPPPQPHTDIGKPYRKNDIPLGMRPPPMPKKPQKWPQRDHSGQYIPLVHHSNREQPHRNPSPGRDSPYIAVVQNYDTINYNSELFKNDHHNKRHPVNSNNNNYAPPTIREEIKLPQNIPYVPTQQNNQHYGNIINNPNDRPSTHIETEALNSVNTHVDFVNAIQHAPILLPDNTNFVDQSAINPLLVNLQPSQVANVIIPHGSSTALIYSGEHSQKGEIFNDPSPYPDAKVEHVVDALSTARPPPEGEGITHAARVPIHTNNLDVPVSPHGINVAAGNQPIYQQHHQQVYNQEQQRHEEVHRPHFQHQEYYRRPVPQNNEHYKFEMPLKNEASLDDFLQPPPPTRAEEDEYIFGDKTNEQEGGEVTQESNARPLLPGQLPTELTPNPSTSMPIDPIDDERRGNNNNQFNQRPKRPARPEQDINFSVVNSKPVQLDGLSNINNQAPIINGRPGAGVQGSQFKDKSQATLAIGTPTKLKPDESVKYSHSGRPSIGGSFINPALFAAISHEIVHDNGPKQQQHPVRFDSQKVQNQIQQKPMRDNTVHTMNLDEKLPPLPHFEIPPSPETVNIDLDSQPSTSRPVNVLTPNQHDFDRNSPQDDSVMGLSPPPPERYPILDETSSHPVLPMKVPQRRPILPPRKPKPPPPYRFEIPPPPINEEPPLPTLPPKMEPPPPPPPMLPDTLSPPRVEEDYFHKIPVKKPVKSEHQWNFQPESKPDVITQAEILNPVLKGVLTVEERPQQPEVITADSKVLTNIVKGHRPKPDIGIKIAGSQLGMQTVVVGKPVPLPVTNVASDIIELSEIQKPKPTKIWEDIVGSEPPPTVDIHAHTATPVKQQKHTVVASKKEPSVLVTSGVTTIFGNYFTQKTAPSQEIQPTKSVDNHYSVVSVVVEPEKNKTRTEDYVKPEKKGHHEVVMTVEDLDGALDTFNDIITSPPPTTFVVTHTQTTTVTSVQTTVVNSKGKLPSTHTLVLTKTKTSTLLDTITEVHTLVTQTSILSTITKTVPHIVSTIYTSPVPVTPEEILVQGEIETTKKPEKSEPKPPALNPHDNESILLVVTDKKSGSISIPVVTDNQPPPEIQVDENNEILPNEIQKGSVFSTISSSSECKPECKASRNELCQKIDNQMRCVCRPGFARMFPDRPCKPTYTYTMKLVLDRYGKDRIRYQGPLQDPNSGPYHRLVDATRDGLDRMVMQSDLRDVYHGVDVRGFEPATSPDNAIVKFYVQLSDNTEETRLQEVLRKSLRTNNFSLGGTEVYAAKEQIQYLLAEDFDECTDPKYHDCSEDAQCFNLRGTYTCSCKEGFSDLSPNTQYPGRVCSAEQIGCEHCNYHGTCFSRNNEEIVCECFQWYGGSSCQYNLKVVLLVLVTAGVCLAVLLLVCCVLACMRRRGGARRGPGGVVVGPGGGYRRYRPHHGVGTGDKRAMISLDTSSEGSVDHTPPPAYIKQAAVAAQRQHKMQRKASKAPSIPPPLMPAPIPVAVAGIHTPGATGTMEQRDRSLTVMIPRAKYRPAPSQPSNTLLTMSTFGPEQKLLNYLNPSGRNTPDKQGSRNTSRKPSNSTNHSEPIRSRKPSSQPPAPRKPSTGALVSAGFEVSATVGRTRELDEAFLEAPHTDLSQPGFNTIRTAESCIIVDIPPPPTLEAELEDIIHKVDRLTVSEARSYDETTIHPPTKSLHQDYDTKRLSSSSHRNDEGHTMVERDIGSTFVMPKTELFKTDRGSDISNFDSL